MRTGNIMIGAVKSGKIVFDGHKRVFYKDEKGDNFVAFVSGYDEITTDPGNSDEITKKLQSWAKRKGFKINKGIGATTALRRSFLSSAEYQKAKKLKNFKAENYKWDPTNQLYKKIK